MSHARQAASLLGIPTGTIYVGQPQAGGGTPTVGALPSGESDVMYRGRAADKLAKLVAGQPWAQFDRCPHADLREPGRLHVDPLGRLHLCQGICVGNTGEASLGEICARYQPDVHPITGPLLLGGPAGLVRRYGLPVAETYADACHPCYAARRLLRERFPSILGPDQMYGVPDVSSN